MTLLLATPMIYGTHPPLGIVYAVLTGALASGLGYAIWDAALPRLTATKAASIQLSVRSSRRSRAPRCSAKR